MDWVSSEPVSLSVDADEDVELVTRLRMGNRVSLRPVDKDPPLA